MYAEIVSGCCCAVCNMPIVENFFINSLYSIAKFPELNAYVFQSHRCFCCSSHHFPLKYNARVAEHESEIAAINCIINAIRKST